MKLLIEDIPGIGSERKNSIRYANISANQLRRVALGLNENDEVVDIFNSLPKYSKLWLQKPTVKVPRKIAEYVYSIFKKHISFASITLAGSYRRGSRISGDIDLVVVVDNRTQLINAINKPLLVLNGDIYASGADKISAIITVNSKNYHIDIFIGSPSEEAALLLYATGSQVFNIRTRAAAKRLGMLLNQRGLFKPLNGKMRKLYTPTEADILKKIQVSYKEPSQRNE
jgi:DNA polymerase/3'-5' exonuclease PolX